MTVALDQLLLDVLVCPEDHGTLLYVPSASCLYNPRLRRKYAITEDIPVMLVDEAEEVADDAEHEALVAAAEGSTGGG
ncbi:MAG: Trm112 family protein [Acidimicrobiales bacterium]|nr:Trm112 family protein [Acidimicrobiales bacterium]